MGRSKYQASKSINPLQAFRTTSVPKSCFYCKTFLNIFISNSCTEGVKCQAKQGAAKLK